MIRSAGKRRRPAIQRPGRFRCYSSAPTPDASQFAIGCRNWTKQNATPSEPTCYEQWRWPVGMPLCRPMGKGLWEVRTDLPGKRTARVLICLYQGCLVALHGFIKKTRATPEDDLELARKRQKELEQ